MASKPLVTHWIWWSLLGLVLIILGFILLSTPVITTFISAVYIGILFLLAGIVYLITALVNRHYEYFWTHLLIAIMTLLIGIIILFNPTLTLMALTLLIGAFFLTIGVLRVLGSLILRFESWGWVFVNGLISIILGILILAHWPASSFFIIGIFLGIDLIFAGWALIIMSWFFRKTHKGIASRTTM